MRSLEFRAWHVPTQRLFSALSFTPTRVYELLEPSENPDYPSDVYTEAFRREDCKLMQWTGLIDPDGVKIFEGDVLAINPAEDVPGDVTLYVEVVFQQGCFGTIILGGDPADDNDFEAFATFNHLTYTANVHSERVVGNVFQFIAPSAVTLPDPVASEPAKLNLGKRELCQAHQALLAWQNALDEFDFDAERGNKPLTYQAHFTWLKTLQGIPPAEKNKLFVVLRDRAANRDIYWDAPTMKFYEPVSDSAMEVGELATA
ncbi:YopX family protein [Spirosoma arcticum]